jgi:hypothetical protein
VSSPTAEAPEPTGPDTDTLREGDQTTPDVAGEDESAEGDQTAPDVAGEDESAEAPESDERTGAEEPDDENLPGGGHADGPGDVDHQFEGQE